MNRPTGEGNLPGVWLFLAVIFLVVATAVSLWRRPPIFLVDHANAKWIQVDAPWDLAAKPPEPVTAFFKKKISVESNFTKDRSTLLSGAHWSFLSSGSSGIYFDGVLIGRFPKESMPTETEFTLPPFVPNRQHELVFVIQNVGGPALMRAESPELRLGTGGDWPAGSDGSNWSAALPADRNPPAEIADQFPSAAAAFWKMLPIIGPLFAILCLSVYYFGDKLALEPAAFRNIILVVWAAVGINDLLKIPLTVGFDAAGHFEYIRMVAERWRIPKPDEGWVMFHPPLYYIVSAVFYRILGFVGFNSPARFLRLIPLACGAFQIEACYRLLQKACPRDRDSQLFGLMFAGALPMNFYLSQSLGNEPIAGIFSAMAVVKTVDIISNPKRRSVDALQLGLVLGLGLLSKSTLILLIPPIIYALAVHLDILGAPQRRSAAGGYSPSSFIGSILLAAFLISGWYYMRNWIQFGKPFISGWDPVRGISWWQEPGFRNWTQLLSFGSSLVKPVYSGLHGFWDSLYSTFWLDGFLSSMIRFEARPPWNYAPMIAGAWLGLAPSAGILLGVYQSFREPRDVSAPLRFSVLCAVVYLYALIVLYVRLPIYATAKATYAIGLMPCFALLCASGLRSLCRGGLSRAAVFASLGVWAFASYLSYFVI